jgi:hypothetical protein
MLKLLQALALVLLLTAARADVAAQPPTTPAMSAADTLNVEQDRADLDLLRRALEEAHGGLYRFVGKREFDARFDALRERLPSPVARSEFIEQLLSLLAVVRDGHMRLELDDASTAAQYVAPLLPLGVALEGNRLIVTSNDARGDTAIRPGMELLAVNGHATRELVERFLPLIPGDGFSATRKRAMLARSFAPMYWLFIDRASWFALTVRGEDSVARVVRVDGVKSAHRATVNNPLNATMSHNAARLDGPEENVSLRWVSEPDIAVVRVQRFDGARYRREVDSVFRIIRDRNARRVILDLRGNGGGDDLYGAYLVSQFTDRSFRYFDRIHVTTIKPSFATWKPSTFDELRNGTVPDPAGGFLVTPALHVGVAEQSPAAMPFLGPLVVLMDGFTFSTAADVVAQLRSMQRATFVGEESGGAYEGNTSGLNALIVLPASRLKLKIMMYGYWNAVRPAPGGRGTLPDHAVPLRTADILRGVDPPFEKAVEFVRRP